MTNVKLFNPQIHLIYPQFTYCNITWEDTYLTYLIEILTLHNKKRFHDLPEHVLFQHLLILILVVIINLHFDALFDLVFLVRCLQKPKFVKKKSHSTIKFS